MLPLCYAAPLQFKYLILQPSYKTVAEAVFGLSSPSRPIGLFSLLKTILTSLCLSFLGVCLYPSPTRPNEGGGAQRKFRTVLSLIATDGSGLGSSSKAQA